ncbi:NAD(P)/FAD-dependent oxidoreductase [Nocardia sp. NPDC006630]|uniref:flavin-containing monooxygenase n=1 Tax=Nocardia sp. NPDC006630 TaxID=3157181 RepID=UPI0033B5FC04
MSGQPDHEVVIVGAGFAGMGAAIKLREIGIEDFLVVERREDVGGTWRDNTYPGVGVDIPSFTYSYHFDQNPNWSRAFAPGAELMRYATGIADKYRLRDRLRFNTSVEIAEYDDTYHRWTLTLDDGTTLTARFLISCHGVLVTPVRPNIPGLENFRGKVLRSAAWDHSYDYTGKRVAVIGTGASALQIVPAIAEQTAQLDVYQRTAIWVMPKINPPIPRALQWIFATVPLAQRTVRLVTTALSDGTVILGAVYHRQLPFLPKVIAAVCRMQLRIQVRDAAIRRKLTPAYGFGCKRPSFSNTYLRAFNRDDVELVTDPIARVTDDGITTESGQTRKVDAVVLATGFKVFDVPYTIRGIDGLDLEQLWADDRKQAYQGSTLPQFPNLFLVPGPYGVSGASWFGTIDLGVTHAAKVIGEAHRRHATRVAPTHEAHQRFLAETLRKVGNEVFNSPSCSGSNSYYTDEHGDAPFLRPSLGLFSWFSVRNFDRADYSFTSLPARRPQPGTQRSAEVQA